MAVYEYKCSNGHEYTELRSIKEDQVRTECECCGEVLKQVYTAPLMQLKGTGFYRNNR